MPDEPDDNTLDNAGPEGRHLADAISEQVEGTVAVFDAAKRVAILRIAAHNLENAADCAREAEGER